MAVAGALFGLRQGWVSLKGGENETDIITNSSYWDSLIECLC